MPSTAQPDIRAWLVKHEGEAGRAMMDNMPAKEGELIVDRTGMSFQGAIQDQAEDLHHTLIPG